MPEKQLRRMNAHYALIQGLFWGGYATIWAFLTVLLLYRGFSNSQIGVVSFLALTLPIVVQPGLAALADRDGRFTSRRLGLALVCLAATAAGVMWAWGANRLLTAVLYVLIGVCLTATQPFFSSMAMEWQMAGADLNFGLGRGIGSACYAALVLLLGQLTERYAPTLVVPVFAGLFAILALAVWRFRSAPAPRMEGERPQVLTNLQLLRKYPRFVLLLAACALLMACHSSSCTYMIHIVEKAGAGAGAMGAALALAAFLELPAMGLFSRMRQRLSLAWLLRLCAGAFLAKIVVFWLAESMTAIYLASVLQFFEYGIFTPATVYYVVEHIDRGNQVKGQALISVASSGVGSAFGSLCCGLILDRAGVSGMLLFEVACAAAGCVVMLLATGEGKRK